MNTAPFISHLPDACVKTDAGLHFLPKKGEKVIIERFATVLPGSPWMDTKVYQVMEVDQEVGRLKLFDQEFDQITISNFKEATLEHGWRFKEFGPMLPSNTGTVTVTRVSEDGETVVQERVAVAKPSVKAPKEPSGGPKERRVYSTKGVTHACIKGVYYTPKDNVSRFQAGDRVLMAVNPDGSLQVDDETWAVTPWGK